MADINWGLIDTQMPQRFAAIPQQAEQQGIKNALAAIQLQQGASQNKLAGMQVRQAEETIARQNQLRALAPQLSGKKPEEVVNLLMANGFRDEAMKAAESYAKVRKDEREERGFGIKAALDKSKFYLDRLPSVNSREGAASWLAAQYNDPDLGRILSQASPLEVELQNIPADPAGLEDWKRRTATDMATYRKNNEPKVVGTSLMTGTGQVLGTAPAPAVAPRQPNPVADLLIPDASGRLVENTPLINAKARVAAAGRAAPPNPALANMPKLKQGERWNSEAQRVEAVPGSDIYIKQRGAHGKDLGALQAVDTKTETALQKIDELLKPENREGFNANFGGYNAYLSRMLPGDTTQNTRKLIDSIKSDLKAAGLEVMRQGGSIGQMTVQEWPIVEQMVAAIDPVLGEENARQQFLNVKNYLNSIRTKAREKYDTEWGGSQYSRSSNDSDPLGLRRK